MGTGIHADCLRIRTLAWREVQPRGARDVRADVGVVVQKAEVSCCPSKISQIGSMRGMSRASEHCCPDEVWSCPSPPLHLSNATSSVKLHSAASSSTEPFLSLAIIASCSQLLFWIFFKSWPFVWFLNSHLPMSFLSSLADSSMCRLWPMSPWNPDWTGGIMFTLCFMQRRISWVPNLPTVAVWYEGTPLMGSLLTQTQLCCLL